MSYPGAESQDGSGVNGGYSAHSFNNGQNAGMYNNGGYGTQDFRAPNKKKTGYIVALVILAILALPVLIPLGLCAGSGLLVLGLCIGGGLLVVGLCIGGGLLTAILCVGGALLTLALCILGGLICLAAIVLASVIGIGVGVILMFQTPASGMAVTGLSLLILGCVILCTPLVWGFIQLCNRGMRGLIAWIGKKIRNRRNNREAGRRQEESQITVYPVSVQKGADDEK